MTLADRSAAVPAERVLLVGMMGSGKSSAGHALARLLDWPFLDNDALVERATGRTARELATDAGEGALRSAESAALRTGLAVPPPAIIGVAGGVLLDPADRASIRDGGFTVWLRATPEVLAARAVGGEHRPWLADDPIGWFRSTAALREPLYAEVADLVLDTGATTPRQAAELIVAALVDRAGSSVASRP